MGGGGQRPEKEAGRGGPCRGNWKETGRSKLTAQGAADSLAIGGVRPVVLLSQVAASPFPKRSGGRPESARLLLCPRVPPPTRGLLLLPSPLTFVPDQVVAEEDEQDEQQKDDECHDPADDGVVGAGGRGHRARVWREAGRCTQSGLGQTYISWHV